MNAGTTILQLQETETIPPNSSYLLDMGDGSGTKRVTQETINKEVKDKTIDILESKEEIEANTDEGKIAGAMAVKESMEILSEMRTRISEIDLGEHFEKISRDKLKDNLLLVDLGTEKADANKTRLFNHPESSNSPVDNDYFMGIWKCYWFSVNHVMVELKEMYPVAGRVWTNFFNNTRWCGWNSITPT